MDRHAAPRAAWRPAHPLLGVTALFAVLLLVNPRDVTGGVEAVSLTLPGADLSAAGSRVAVAADHERRVHTGRGRASRASHDGRHIDERRADDTTADDPRRPRPNQRSPA